jgi:hypothetical protein
MVEPALVLRQNVEAGVKRRPRASILRLLANSALALASTLLLHSHLLRVLRVSNYPSEVAVVGRPYAGS